MRAQAQVEFRCKPLNPTPYRGVIDLNSSFLEQFLHLAVRQALAQIPTNRAKNDLRFEVPPFEEDRTLAHQS